MRVTLTGVAGPGTGVTATLTPGVSVTVGRTERAGVIVAADSFLSGLHFELSCSAQGAMVRDLGSRNGVLFLGQRVAERALADGDRFTAGSSEYLVRIEPGQAEQQGHASQPVQASPAIVAVQASHAGRADQTRLLPQASLVPPVGQTLLSQVTILSSLGEPLYAVLDAARDPAILELLRGGTERYFSLYHGQSAVELESVAPYLVSLPPRCELLSKLIEMGWSKSWGIFVASSLPMEDIWRQLRRSLMVTVNGAQHYFRFYDPRVLRAFLGVADGGQWAEFSGPIRFFVMESEDAKSLVRYFSHGYGVSWDQVPVEAAGP